MLRLSLFFIFILLLKKANENHKIEISASSFHPSSGRRRARLLTLAPGPAGAASLAAPLASGAAGPADGLLLGARALLAVALLAAGGAAALAVGDLLGAASALGGASAVGHGRFGWLVDEVCLVDKENKGCTVFFGGVFF